MTSSCVLSHAFSTVWSVTLCYLYVTSRKQKCWKARTVYCYIGKSNIKLWLLTVSMGWGRGWWIYSGYSRRMHLKNINRNDSLLNLTSGCSLGSKTIGVARSHTQPTFRYMVSVLYRNQRNRAPATSFITTVHSFWTSVVCVTGPRNTNGLGNED